MTDTKLVEKPTMRVRRMSELPKSERPSWLALGWLPRKELIVLVGEEGLGKSLFWVVIAAHITRGIALPQINLPQRAPEDVVVIVTEDSRSEVQARLSAAGADLSRMHLFSNDDDGSPTFPEDMDVLYQWAEDTGIKPALVVVDAWLDTVDPSMQVRNPQNARQALGPWKEAATKLCSSVMLLTHTNRMDTSNTRDLVGSTAALRQKARMILFAARSPKDGRDGGDQHLWVGPEKSNSTRISNALKFAISIEQCAPATVDDPGTVATLISPQNAGATIRELVEEWRREVKESDRPASSEDKAEIWVANYMADKTVVPVQQIKAEAKKAGIAERALTVAMSALGESKPAAPNAPWLFKIRSLQDFLMSQETADIAETADTELPAAPIPIRSLKKRSSDSF